jgi:hypothetical protein
LLYYLAYMDLDSCRSVGFAEGPIPWTAVQLWAQVHDLDKDTTAALHHHVREMDKAYLKHRSKKSGDQS